MEGLTGLEFWAQFGIAGVFAITMFWLLLRQSSDHKDEIQKIEKRHVAEVVDIYTRRDVAIEEQSKMLDLVIKSMDSNTDATREISTVVERMVSVSGIEKKIEGLIESARSTGSSG